jgi:hypothetical protein
MKTFEEIIKIIDEHNLYEILCAYGEYGESIDQYNWDHEMIDVDEIDDNSIINMFKRIGLGEIDSVYSVCNSDELYNVVLFKDHQIYIKFIGEFDSYGNGEHYYNSNISSATQVFPKEVTKTIYE